MTTPPALPKMIPAAVVGYHLGVRCRTLVSWGKDPDHDFPSPHRWDGAWHFDEAKVMAWIESNRHEAAQVKGLRSP